MSMAVAIALALLKAIPALEGIFASALNVLAQGRAATAVARKAAKDAAVDAAIDAPAASAASGAADTAQASSADAHASQETPAS